MLHITTKSVPYNYHSPKAPIPSVISHVSSTRRNPIQRYQGTGRGRLLLIKEAPTLSADLPERVLLEFQNLDQRGESLEMMEAQNDRRKQAPRDACQRSSLRPFRVGYGGF